MQLASSGADVAVTDIHQRVEPLCELAAEISQMGRKSIATTADVTDRTDIDHLIGRGSLPH
jgi:NADP-dependent 3-hydroxy acid dehydrogenase YdfG